jgi:hypothetical protein
MACRSIFLGVRARWRGGAWARRERFDGGLGIADVALARLDSATLSREDEYAALTENGKIARKTLRILRAADAAHRPFAAWAMR